MAIKLEDLSVIMDELLFFGSSQQFEGAIETAKKQFSKSDQEEFQLSTDIGFTDWYLHDYVFENKMYLTDLFRKDRSLNDASKNALESVANSFLSVFEIRGSAGNFFLKDIFTNQDYGIENAEDVALMNNEGLHFTRLYPVGEKYIIMPETIVLSMDYKALLVKAFMEQYNQYAQAVGAADVADFAYGHPLIIYKIVHILEDVEADAVFDDNEYKVFQSVYLYQELSEVREALESDDRFECALEEGDDYVFKLYESEAKKTILSEIVLCEHRLEAECLSDRELQEAKAIIEKVLGERIAFLQDEVVDFDDLL